MVKKPIISVATVIDMICDPDSFYMISIVARMECDTQSLLYKTELPTRAFYTRMSRFLKAGVIERKNSKYYLTSFGEIVFHATDLISAAMNNYWRLSALDSISLLDDLPMSEYTKTIKILLGNREIGDVVSKHLERPKNNESQILLNPISEIVV